MLEIQELLSEGRDAACERERTTFDALTAPYGHSLVLFGAGGLGRKTLRGLRQIGIEPLAFADNNPVLWEKPMVGVPVMSPQVAAARYGKTAAFVVTTWAGEGRDRMRDRVQFLRHLGCRCVTTFGPLFWKYPDIFLPHYAMSPAHEVWDQQEAVLDAAGLWSDDASRREYLAQIRWRLLLDFDGLPNPVKHPIYFPDDLCPLRADECFVDCGAYDGDTLASFVSESGGRFRRAISFEPDPSSFAKLEQRVAAMPDSGRVALHKAGAGAGNWRVMFNADGLPSAAMGTGTLEIDCVKLDDVLANEEPTYIKMDIEGAEPDALMGAREIIARHQPVLAICSYHRQDHVWRIPRLIHSLHAGYHLFLRPHVMDVWDLVCYAIPEGRLS